MSSSAWLVTKTNSGTPLILAQKAVCRCVRVLTSYVQLEPRSCIPTCSRCSQKSVGVVDRSRQGLACWNRFW